MKKELSLAATVIVAASLLLTPAAAASAITPPEGGVSEHPPVVWVEDGVIYTDLNGDGVADEAVSENPPVVTAPVVEEADPSPVVLDDIAVDKASPVKAPTTPQPAVATEPTILIPEEKVSEYPPTTWIEEGVIYNDLNADGIADEALSENPPVVEAPIVEEATAGAAATEPAAAPVAQEDLAVTKASPVQPSTVKAPAVATESTIDVPAEEAAVPVAEVAETEETFIAPVVVEEATITGNKEAKAAQEATTAEQDTTVQTLPRAGSDDTVLFATTLAAMHLALASATAYFTVRKNLTI